MLAYEYLCVICSTVYIGVRCCMKCVCVCVCACVCVCVRVCTCMASGSVKCEHVGVGVWYSRCLSAMILRVPSALNCTL